MSVLCTWCDLPKDVQSLIMIYRGWACLSSSRLFTTSPKNIYRQIEQKVLPFHLLHLFAVEAVYGVRFFWINRAFPTERPRVLITADDSILPEYKKRKIAKTAWKISKITRK